MPPLGGRSAIVAARAARLLRSAERQARREELARLGRAGGGAGDNSDLPSSTANAIPTNRDIQERAQDIIARPQASSTERDTRAAGRSSRRAQQERARRLREEREAQSRERSEAERQRAARAARLNPAPGDNRDLPTPQARPPGGAGAPTPAGRVFRERANRLEAERRRFAFLDNARAQPASIFATSQPRQQTTDELLNVLEQGLVPLPEAQDNISFFELASGGELGTPGSVRNAVEDGDISASELLNISPNAVIDLLGLLPLGGVATRGARGALSPNIISQINRAALGPAPLSPGVIRQINSTGSRFRRRPSGLSPRLRPGQSFLLRQRRRSRFGLGPAAAEISPPLGPAIISPFQNPLPGFQGASGLASQVPLPGFRGIGPNAIATSPQAPLQIFERPSILASQVPLPGFERAIPPAQIRMEGLGDFLVSSPIRATSPLQIPRTSAAFASPAALRAIFPNSPLNFVGPTVAQFPFNTAMPRMMPPLSPLLPRLTATPQISIAQRPIPSGFSQFFPANSPIITTPSGLVLPSSLSRSVLAGSATILAGSGIAAGTSSPELLPNVAQRQAEDVNLQPGRAATGTADAGSVPAVSPEVAPRPATAPQPGTAPRPATAPLPTTVPQPATAPRPATVPQPVTVPATPATATETAIAIAPATPATATQTRTQPQRGAPQTRTETQTRVSPQTRTTAQSVNSTPSGAAPAAPNVGSRSPRVRRRRNADGSNFFESRIPIPSGTVPDLVGWRQGLVEYGIDSSGTVRVGRDLHEAVPNNPTATPQESARVLRLTTGRRHINRSFRLGNQSVNIRTIGSRMRDANGQGQREVVITFRRVPSAGGRRSFTPAQQRRAEQLLRGALEGSPGLAGVDARSGRLAGAPAGVRLVGAPTGRGFRATRPRITV